MKTIKNLFPLILIFGFISISSCDNDLDLCLKGTVEFKNNDIVAFDLYVNGKYVEKIKALSSVEHEYYEGTIDARVEQANGIILIPIIREKSIIVYGCDKTTWKFPY